MRRKTRECKLTRIWLKRLNSRDEGQREGSQHKREGSGEETEDWPRRSSLSSDVLTTHKGGLGAEKRQGGGLEAKNQGNQGKWQKLLQTKEQGGRGYEPLS